MTGNLQTAIGQVRSGVRAAAMATRTLVGLQVAAVHRRIAGPERRYQIWQQHMRAWARDLLRVFNFEQLWVSPPPRAGSCGRLVVANHRSPIDIILLLQHFGGCVVSRSDLATWPVLGRAAREAETIFVDRDNTRSGVAAIREIRRRLQAGRTVIVFPEGATYPGDEVRPLQGGAFAAARGLPIEIVPVGIAYQPGAEFYQETFAQHVARVAARPRTRVALCAGAPRPISGSRKELSQKLQIEVQSLVNTARQHLQSAAVG